MNQYTVEPFSLPTYRKNADKLGAQDYGCAICGKPLKLPYAHEAAVVFGGTWAQTEEEAQNTADPGHMGVWGIGPDCHKRYLVRPAKPPSS